MRISSCFSLAAGLALAALSSPLFAKADAGWSTDHLDDAWAERALAHPELDQGWCQLSHPDDSDHRVVHCEVREFSYPRVSGPVAIDGGENSGMTAMGWDRDHVRILYRVMTRALTEERARALAAEVQLELTKGWLRPDGPSVTREGETWMVEVKAWVPRSSDLVLSTQNGPLGVRDVHGTMDLSSVNGPVSLVDLGGAVQARIQNGPLHVALAGSRWDGAGLDAEAENGPLNLVLPADYSARFQTGTIYGPWGMDYPIGSNHRRGWITTTLGKGGPPVRVVTHNGPFQITER
jgi:hypothetical protein